MDDNLFDLTAKHLENRTDLDLLEARGTLRLALEKAGLNPKSLTLKQLQVVFQKVLPKELELRGIRYIQSVCNSVLTRVIRTADTAEAAPAESIDETFRRLGGESQHSSGRRHRS
jgi:hypothetical protein